MCDIEFVLFKQQTSELLVEMLEMIDDPALDSPEPLISLIESFKADVLGEEEV